MSVEFFGVRNMGQLGGINKIGPAGENQKTTKSGDKGEVSFSTVLQGAYATSATGSTEETERASRVQELKSQVASGSYQPDLNKVASSLLKFLVEG
ncbi:MAG: flagellar biosynthesis anti-sigma factor FlgM [Desulfobulbus sp.]